MPAPLPPPTGSNLFPPCDFYDFFQHSEAHPFESNATSYSEVNAAWLADASLLAYSEETIVRSAYRKAGFPDVTTFNGQSTRGYIASNSEVVIVSFRGTQVVKRAVADEFKNAVADWLTDAKFALAESDYGGFVHVGFNDALNAIWTPFLESIEALLTENPKRSIWMTGHSLGAALATLAANRFGKVQCVYTFGSPRVGDSDFHARYRVSTYRIVHQDDIVARVPIHSGYVAPRFKIGSYKHVGEFALIDASGEIHTNPSLWTESRKFFDAQIKAILTATGVFRHGGLWALSPSVFYNHSPLYYAMRLRL